MFEKARKFLEDERASLGGGGGVVGTLVGIMVSLLIAIIVVMSLISSQTQAGWSLSANNTWTALQSNIWVALTLLVIEVEACCLTVKSQLSWVQSSS